MTTRRKLIEVALPLDAINAESAREKSIRHGHPSTLHLWWARRPLAAARAVLFAQLVDDPSSHPDRFPNEDDQRRERKRLFGILERLVPWEASNDDKVLAEARAEILKSCDGKLPTIIDPFGGGGAIPLESARLGLPTVAGDLNPVAVLIQKAMLEIPHRFANKPPIHPHAIAKQTVWNGAEGLAEDVEAYGQWMREEAFKRIGHHYPNVTLDDGSQATPIAWIWARTVKSPDPAWPAHIPLVRSWELRRRPGKPSIWIKPNVDHKTKTITYSIQEGGKPPSGTVERGRGICLATGTPISGDYIKSEGIAGRIGNQLMAVVCESSHGRRYLCASDLESKLLSVPRPPWLPEGAMSDHPQYMGTPRYGIDEWHKIFSTRQLLALTTFSDLLAEVRTRVLENASVSHLEQNSTALSDNGTGAVAYTEAILTYLAITIDKSADYWSSLCTWGPPRETIQHTFARQAVSMTWDYPETNPFSSSTGNWYSMLTWVTKALQKLPTQTECRVLQLDAVANLSKQQSAVLSTDPPYYDNVPYSDLSDFFYVWIRRNLKAIWPDLFATVLTPKSEELVANHVRAGSKDAARKHFEGGMTRVFEAAAEAHDPSYPAAVFYAFKSTEQSDEGLASTGWETFLAGVLEAGWSIGATWPMRTEMPSRTRAIDANALASSVVLSMRRKAKNAPIATRGDFATALRYDLRRAVSTLQEQNIPPVDLAQASIGPGIAVFSRYSRVVEANGEKMTIRNALALINEVLTEILSGEEAEFDPDTRFALTWFEQFGYSESDFGVADILAKAKNTSVANIVRSGIASSRGGKFRLLRRSELVDEWKPEDDTKVTIWEIVHYLIRALEHSEVQAAALLATVGPGLGARARQLCYMLYQIAERRRSEDAGIYNMLVAAWPQLQRLASGESGNSDESLF
jgi:putative DNA methylase